MNKRTGTIRLKELQDRYYDRLQEIAYKVYDEQLHNLIIRPEELDMDIRQYFRYTLPSLQEFYSRYAAQWEYFHETDEASDTKFLHFLKNSAYPLSMRYNMVDLNVKYYLERFQALKPRSKEWKALRTLFFDKWHRLLSNNEFNYQMEHINRLSEEFYRLQISLSKKLPIRGDSRLVWLLRNHKQIAEQILEYDETIKKTPAIQELIEILGKQRQGRQKRFKMTAGIRKEEIVTHSTRSDITGICEGNDLNSLLPIEYCYLAEKSLQPIFFERYTEKKLRRIDYASRERQPMNDKRLPGNQVSEEAEGPFIVCIDTSGSMSGKRENLAKSALLAIAELTEQQHRKCYIIIFSDDVECIEITDLGTSFDRLVDFLCQSFHSGTDIAPAIAHTARMIEKEEYREADFVMISDFEMAPIDKELSAGIQKIKENQTRIYALCMGDEPQPSYLNICERYWMLPT